MSLKDRISSPLEAGHSVHGSHDLPRPVVSALEYASKKLAVKAVHFTLLVVRREYQLPLPGPSAIASPEAGCSRTPEFQNYSQHTPLSTKTSHTPTRTTFPVSRFASFTKTFSRSSAPEADSRVLETIVVSSPDGRRDATASPTFSEVSSASVSTASSRADSTFSALRHSAWSTQSPMSPSIGMGSSTPATPATPLTVASSASSATMDSVSVASGVLPQDPQQFGMRLITVNPLSMREERMMERVFEKAARKFRLGDNWLPLPIPPSTAGFPADTTQNSLAQHEILFSSGGLTLLALDQLYTFKSALQSYTHTRTPSGLEDAVDELRRLILATSRQKLLKSVLVDHYTWLGPVQDDALNNVGRMYGRAYGDTGLVNDVDTAWPLPNVPLEIVDEDEPERRRLAAEAALVARAEAEAEKEMREVEMKLLEAAAAATSRRKSERGRRAPVVVGQDQEEQQQPEKEDEEEELPALIEEKGAVPHIRVSTNLDLQEIENWYRQVDIGLGINLDSPTRKENDATTQEKAVDDASSKTGEEASTTTSLSRTPTASSSPTAQSQRGPALKLQTTFTHIKARLVTGDSSANASTSATKTDDTLPLPLAEDDEEEEELTARPKSAVVAQQPFQRPCRWDSLMSIDALLSPARSSCLSVPGAGGDMVVGPATPKGYDDISPITRGEWGFLMFAQTGRTVGVETC